MLQRLTGRQSLSKVTQKGLNRNLELGVPDSEMQGHNFMLCCLSCTEKFVACSRPSGPKPEIVR